MVPAAVNLMKLASKEGQISTNSVSYKVIDFAKYYKAACDFL